MISIKLVRVRDRRADIANVTDTVAIDIGLVRIRRKRTIIDSITDSVAVGVIASGHDTADIKRTHQNMAAEICRCAR